jgi:tetratricopeptide (TPR) repeat protein
MFSSLPSHWGLRPLITLSLALDYWFGDGLNPFYFHLSTFILYAIMLIVLYFFYQKILNTNNNNASTLLIMFITAFYGIHTANAETINYIISRSDVYSTFFILLSFSIFVYFPKYRNRYLYIIPALLGVLTKETVLTLVILLFFYILLFERKMSLFDCFNKSNFSVIGNIILQLLPLTIAVGILQYYTLSKIQSTTDISNPLGYYILTQPYVWLRYFIAFFIPANLSADSDWTVIMNPFDERIIVGLCFFTTLVFSVFHYSKKEETKPFAFGLIWFGVTLLPTSIAPFAEVTNDHRMFYAFIGLTLSLGNVLIRLWKNYTSLKYSAQIFLSIGFILIAAHAYGVRERNKVWKTEESLWLDVTIKSPTNGRGLMNYGLTQMSKGNYVGANEYFQKAQQYVPYYPTLFVNMGVLKSATQQIYEADLYFKKAIELTKGHEHSPYNFYGKFLINQQRFDEAEKILLESHQINKYDPEALKYLCQLYSQTQNWDKLNWSSKSILKIDPNDKDGELFLNQSIKKETAKIPNEKINVVAQMINKSLILYNENKFDECIKVCQDILAIEPNNENAFNNIGAAYNMKKDWEKAAEYCRKALAINPNFNLAKGNLNWALSELKKKK